MRVIVTRAWGRPRARYSLCSARRSDSTVFSSRMSVPGVRSAIVSMRSRVTSLFPITCISRNRGNSLTEKITSTPPVVGSTLTCAVRMMRASDSRSSRTSTGR